ncbi:sugar ABC transporter ATP-binding protein [Desulfosporosinus metallidurans]|nr:sugar ABC transporter ATP-binding protein [Desulfosporosinus metallidurans]
MQHAILQLENINKDLSNYFSLKNISLELHSGETHILVGKNDSGKSTLMNILSGISPADSGNIIFNNRHVQINSPVDAKKLGIIAINQVSSLFEQFSVAENIFIENKPLYNKLFKIISRNEMIKSCQRLLDSFEVKICPTSKISNLSQLQKQVIELLKAFNANAKVVILDEPLIFSVDSETVRFCNIINEMKLNGVSFLITSHQLDKIVTLGDKITIIRDGEIIGTEKTSAVNMGSLTKMMSGKELRDRYPKLSVKIGREVLKADFTTDHFSSGINFTLRKREILGITGLDGSGTKIARSFFGLDPLDKGIFLESQNLKINTPIDAIKAGIGYVTQERLLEGLFNQLNILDNILIPNSCQSHHRFFAFNRRGKDIVNSHIKGLRIRVHNINNRVSSLSGGNQQKILLARWMSTKLKLKVLILDEPTRGIDIPSKVDVYNLINKLVINGTSVIFISSDLNELLGMSDRIMVLYEGKVATILERHQASHEKIMYFATGGT